MVKRRDCEAADIAATLPLTGEFSDSLFHLAGGFVGKGHRGNPVGRITTFVDEIADLLRDHTGLAAARTGEHEQRGADVFHSFQLTGIEFVHREIGKVITGNGLACSPLYTTELRMP